MEEFIAVVLVAAVWLLGVCSLLYSVIEAVANCNPHDSPFPWQRCYWLFVLMVIPIALPLATLFPFLLLPIASMLVLGYCQYAKEDRERAIEYRSRIEMLIKKYPELDEVPLCDPLKCRGDQLRIFDTSSPAPACLGLALKSDINYLIDLYCKTDTYFGHRSNDFHLFLGSLDDDSEPKFVEVLGDEVDDGDFLLSPKISRSKISPELYSQISRRLVLYGTVCLRWTE